MVYICGGSGIDKLGTGSELSQNAVCGPKKTALAGVLESGRQLWSERREKRKGGGAVAENHISPAATDALENGRKFGEVLSNSGHYWQDLTTILYRWVLLAGGYIGLYVLYEDGKELNIV